MNDAFVSSFQNIFTEFNFIAFMRTEKFEKWHLWWLVEGNRRTPNADNKTTNKYVKNGMVNY